MLNRVAAITLGLMLVFATVGIASADTLSGTPSDGFWSYGRYTTGASPGNVVMSSLFISTGVVTLDSSEVSPGREILFDLSGSGQTSLLTSDPTSPDQVYSTITWDSDKLTLGSGFAPSFVTWTAQSAGQYVVSASFTTDQAGNAASAAPVDGQGGGSNQDSSNGFEPFSRTVSVEPGDTIDFLSWDGTSSDPSTGLNFQFAPADRSDPPPDPAPEPSRVVSLFGLAGMAIVGLIWDWRQRRTAS
jgi:hypothetical protein